MKSGYIVYFVMALLAGMFVYAQFFDDSGEHRVEPIRDQAIFQSYPQLYEALYARDVKQIRPFLKNESPAVQKQAWRALASTPIDTVKTFLELALDSELQEPWMALSMHAFKPDQLRQLEENWLKAPDLRAGISLVLGRQGDRVSLDFLLEHLEKAAGTSYEYSLALALGRLMLNYTVEPAIQQRIIEQAFQSENPDIIRAYLYGFYRGNRQSMDEETRRLLYSVWKGYGLGTRDEIDQYIARLLKGDAFYEIILYQNSEDLLNLNIQLSVELAQLADDIVLNDRNKLAVRMLLTHKNPHVVHETLSSLKGRLNAEEKLRAFITTEIIEKSSTHPFIWLQAVETMAEEEPQLVEKYNTRLEEVTDTHLLEQVLAIRQQYDSPEAFMGRVRELLENDDMLRKQFALNAINTYWSTRSEDDKSEGLRKEIRQVVFSALHTGDRGVAYAAAGLLEEERLFDDNDFARIHTALQGFSLPGDLEVYQRFGRLYKQRFEQQAETQIDSLAALGYAPLNRSLRQAGWEIPVPEDHQPELRRPDWERLWEMGQNPVWVLQTEKGFIRIEMNTLSAPATVSAIDSLTRAGSYDGIPFHRVIPNFVIQGGDIERKDGFGGPDFTIPTEASELEFHRGAAGIASAGNDTEGSQYFFLHQWKPHLNGGYTRFGKVIGGMDVVDRILPGDKVLYAYWE